MKIIETIAFVVSLYTMLIVVNIALKWLSTSKGRGTIMINNLTDPFINLFKRLKISHIGFIDISPLLAVVSLTIVNQILGRIRELENLKFGAITAVIISSIWNVIMSLLFLVLVAAVIRYILLMFTTNKLNSFANACDGFFIPLSSRVASRFIKNPSGYQQNLIVFIIVLTILLTAVSFGMKYLTDILMGI